MRLDSYLAKNNKYKSRSRAVNAIESGSVKVNGTVVTDKSFDITGDEEIECFEDPLKYVGRGGLKLEKALSYWNISVENMECIDIGASTGGFTQVLLERGAQKVTAVDVGHGQLDPVLREDSRVENLEGTDARNFDPGKQYDFLSMDVSFISLKFFTETVKRLLKPEGKAVLLIKPQYEVGRKFVGKNGIVRSSDASGEAVKTIVSVYSLAGFSEGKIIPSPIKGGDGNKEYLMFIVKKSGQ